jgi:hypothetical protein
MRLSNQSRVSAADAACALLGACNPKTIASCRLILIASSTRSTTRPGSGQIVLLGSPGQVGHRVLSKPEAPVLVSLRLNLTITLTNYARPGHSNLVRGLDYFVRS